MTAITGEQKVWLARMCSCKPHTPLACYTVKLVCHMCGCLTLIGMVCSHISLNMRRTLDNYGEFVGS